MNEDEILKILTDVADGLETIAKNIKEKVASVVGLAEWDASKISWSKAEGASGEYERSEDVNNLEFKKMLKSLNAHGGHLTKNGYFYWLFRNGATVGRKLRKAEEKQPLQIEQYFPSELHDLLDFAEKGDLIVIKPRQFLGADNFARISAIIRELGGSYVSEGKDSRFEIPKKAV